MNDRELLELAAKAAELPMNHDGSVPDEWLIEIAPGVQRVWNPLTDDGDALRLAVKLRLPISYRSSFGTYQFAPKRKVIAAPRWAVVVGESSQEEMAVDQFSATRRAIVRAAAAIGRAMHG